jgi:subtilisin family serine protease
MTSCGGGVAPPTDDPLVIAFSPLTNTDGTPLAGAVSLQGQASQVEVFLRSVANDPATEQILRVEEDILPFTVPVGAAHKPVQIAVLHMPAGFITQIRIQVDALNAVFPDHTSPIALPGGSLRITPPAPLQVFAAAESDMLVRFRPGDVIRSACGGLSFSNASFIGNGVQGIDIAQGVASDQLNVFFKPGTSAATITTVVTGYDSRATVVRRYPDGLASLALPGERLLSGAVTYFESQPTVDFVAASWPLTFVAFPNDTVPPLYYDSYFETTTSEAHQISMGDAKPIVGIIDSGMKLDHPDVLLNVWINEGELPAGMRANGVAGTGADFDGDGVVTFRDLNSPGHDPFLATFGIGKSAGDPTKVDAYDLLANLSNHTDEDNNTFIDDIVGWNFINQTNDPTPGTTNANVGIDLNVDLHGLVIAGIIGATADNTWGVAGVAPLARMMPLRVGGAGQNEEPNSSRQEQAMAYAQMMHVDIVNVSISTLAWKVSPAPEFGITDPTNQTLKGERNLNDCLFKLGGQHMPPSTFAAWQSQRDRSWQHYGNAFLVALASGNCSAVLSSARRSKISADGVGVPNVSNIIVVTGLSNGLGNSSVPPIGTNIPPAQEPVLGVAGAEQVDIGAPFTNIAIVNGTFNSGRFGASGTSFSAPFVAGAAALILAREPALRGHWADLRTRILSNADKGAAQDLSLQDQGTNLVKSGNELIKDGNRLNVCKAVANGTCPFPHTAPTRDPIPPPPPPTDAGACEVVLECPAGQVFNPATCQCGIIIE